jgi:DNA-binding MarR family transcriptional regulator
MTERAPIRAGADHERRYPGARRLATETIVNLLRAESLVSAELNRKLRPHGLSIATFNVLMILEGAETSLCPWQIGERLLVTRGTVTGLLDSLEKQGLIRRVPNPEDRRSLQVELTAKARKLLGGLCGEHFSNEVEMTEGLSAREQETLVKLLWKLQNHIQAQSG